MSKRVTKATAPGKIILFGEHAVVYGRPAIAAPLMQVRATATVEDGNLPGVRLRALDLSREYWLREATEYDPLARAIHVVVSRAGLFRMPDLTVTVRSSVPIASGLGSSAAMAAAVIRAVAKHLGVTDLAVNEEVAAMTYQVEQLLHGTPSGIDNTVVAFERPVFFMRGEPQNQIETVTVGAPFRFLVGDSGVASATRVVVGDVRQKWGEQPRRYERLFDGCARVARAARLALERGDMEHLGRLMVENQAYLREMTVSSAELERLISSAERAGALGAKLSGAGRGGHMIALVADSDEMAVQQALLDAGARSVLSSILN